MVQHLWSSKTGRRKGSGYSSALARILVAGCKVYIDVLIVSEYVNRYARLKHALLKASPHVPPDFKTFRKSSDFKPVASDIAADVRLILKHSERIESEFQTLDIHSLVDEFEKGNSDFNDQVLADLCKRRNLSLITHDRDFQDCGLNVLTANKKLLV